MPHSLVTGATGFTGSHLVRKLAADGEAVRVLVRPGSTSRKSFPAGVEVVEGDVTDGATVQQAVAGVDTVYHLAAVYREAKHPDSHYARVHVDGTGQLLEAARVNAVRAVRPLQHRGRARPRQRSSGGRAGALRRW